MRATMSLPGSFPPVAIGDMLLVDGGTLNNVNGETGLQVELVRKSWGPPFLALGFELNNLTTTTFAADLSGRATCDGFLGSGSEFRLDFSAGTTQALAAENFRPLWGTRFFVAPRAFLVQTPRYFVQDGDIAAE